MLQTDRHKKWMLLYGFLFFGVQLVLAVLFYRERLFADSSYFVFQPINTGWFSIEHQRFLLAACQILPLAGSYLGLPLKALLILYSLNHVFFFLVLFLFLTVKLDDIYSGLAIVAILVFNWSGLYVMPYLESWYGTGLAVVLYSILKSGKKSAGFMLLVVLLEITIIFSHPGNTLLILMLLLLFMPYKKQDWASRYPRNLYIIMAVILLISAIYKFFTLDTYENGHINRAFHIENSTIPHTGYILTTLQELIKTLADNFKTPILLLLLTIIFYIKSKQLRRAGMLFLFFAGWVLIINFLFLENAMTMYDAIHYIPVVALVTIPFFLDVLSSYPGKVKNIALFLLFAIMAIRVVEQVNAVKRFTYSVEATERLIIVCDKVGGNKFFVKAPDFISPYIDWTYPIQTLLLSAERGKDRCRSIASDEDTAKVSATKQIFSDTSLFLLSRFNFLTNYNLNHNYFNCDPGIYKTVDYISCMETAYSSHLNLQSAGKDWVTKPPEELNGKPAIHFKGDEFGLTLKIPKDSLAYPCKKYYASITLSRFEQKANCSANAMLVCDITDQNMQHTFYASYKMNKEQAIQDSNSRTYTYEFEVPAENINNLQLSFYIWNVKKEDFYISDASIKLLKVPAVLFQR